MLLKNLRPTKASLYEFINMKKIFLTLIILLLVRNGLAGQPEQFRPTVTTPLGEIEGYVGLTVNSNPFFKFEGVPYAKPPVGELRFEEPQDVEPWIGVLKANVLTRCIQYDHFEQDFENNYVVHGDEDCLYLNIYTHSTSQNANFDVLLHIHGGAFMFGRGASYGPDIIMDRNIVYVNFNYRLGPLGFLSTEDDVLPGNTGLKDQIKALKWVKENIKYFGGNPDSITVHGLSAGGASTHLHYLMPASKGLFKQGISQSGCSLNPWVLVENIRDRTAKVADLVGCPTGNSRDLKQCLKTRPARNIVQTVKEFQPFLYNPFSPFGVVVDGHWSTDPVLPDHPYNLLRKGKVYDVPWMISYTSAEGLYPAADFWIDDRYLSEIDTKWDQIMPFILHYNDSVDPGSRDEVSQKIREHYLGNKPVDTDTYSILVDIISDRLFVADLETSARLHNDAVTSDVYSYTFDYKGAASKSYLRTKSTENLGTSHGDDTIYVLSTRLNTVSNERDRNMSKIMVDMVVSFMQYGTPNITSIWLPLMKQPGGMFAQLKFSAPDKLNMEFKNEIGQRIFWDSLPFDENHNFNPVLIKDEL